MIVIDNSDNYVHEINKIKRQVTTVQKGTRFAFPSRIDPATVTINSANCSGRTRDDKSLTRNDKTRFRSAAGGG